MKRGYVLFTIIFLLLVSMSFVSVISAADKTTMVNIRGDDYLQDILIRLKDPMSAGAVFDSIGVKTDAIGRASFEFDTSRSSVQLLLLYIENGNVAKDVLTEEYSTGGVIELDYRENIDPIYPETQEVVEPIEDVVEDPVEEVVEPIEEVQEDSPGILGKVISGFSVVKDKVSAVNWIYYVLGFLVLGGLVVMFLTKNNEPPRDPDVKFIKEEPANLPDAQSKVAAAEEELRKAQANLEAAQSQEAKDQKIQEMKDRLQRDKERLDNLEHQQD